jgi:hypothetical protein
MCCSGWLEERNGSVPPLLHGAGHAIRRLPRQFSGATVFSVCNLTPSDLAYRMMNAPGSQHGTPSVDCSAYVQRTVPRIAVFYHRTEGGRTRLPRRAHASHRRQRSPPAGGSASVTRRCKAAPIRASNSSSVGGRLTIAFLTSFRQVTVGSSGWSIVLKSQTSAQDLYGRPRPVSLWDADTRVEPAT